MKRIALSLMTIAMVCLLAVGATRAWFSDTETSVGNTFTAGTLDLTVDGKEGDQVVHITRDRMVPHDPWSYSYGGQWVLKNTGNIPGKFSVKITNIQNFENGCNTPEIVAGDTTCATGTDQGELGSLVYGKWSENYYGITPPRGWAGSALFNPINTANDVTVNGIELAPGEDIVAYLDLEFDTHAGLTDNLAQGDTIMFDVVFSLDQVH
jgi:predicted ribosomally synthesized peptide with SipW-like signal peptide